ncbi:hypothetical protein ACJJTC_013069 [Scirpophaga incertulas]
MGKRSKLHQEKLLRQRPNTFNSLSRTCSKTSQLTTIITKKNSSTSNRYYYSEGEVHVDLYPSFKKENRIAEDIVYSNNGQTYFLNNCDNMATSPKESVNPKRNESNSTPEITSLFHTIASHSKYTLKSDLDLKKSQQVNNTFENTEKSAIITTLEINKDLHEINSAIVDLSVLAGKALTKHLKNVVQQMATLIKPIEDIRNSNTFKPSILCDAQKLEGTQISYTSDKDKPFSGIKIAKSGKKRYEFTSNMKRKSSSYTIIKSESIINVTDMTKPAMSDAITPKIYMSLSKDSNTLHNQNVITYICDECQSTKTKHSIYNDEETPKNDESKNYNKRIMDTTEYNHKKQETTPDDKIICHKQNFQQSNSSLFKTNLNENKLYEYYSSSTLTDKNICNSILDMNAINKDQCRINNKKEDLTVANNKNNVSSFVGLPKNEHIKHYPRVKHLRKRRIKTEQIGFKSVLIASKRKPKGQIFTSKTKEQPQLKKNKIGHTTLNSTVLPLCYANHNSNIFQDDNQTNSPILANNDKVVDPVKSSINVPIQNTSSFRSNFVNISIAMSHKSHTTMSDNNLRNRYVESCILTSNEILSKETFALTSELLSSPPTPSGHLSHVTFTELTKQAGLNNSRYESQTATSANADSCFESVTTLKPKCKTFFYSENLRSATRDFAKHQNTDDTYNRSAFPDTVLSLEPLLKTHAHTGCNTYLDSNLNKVFVTHNSLSPIINENITANNYNSKSVLQKPIGEDCGLKYYKTVNIEYDNEIKLNETGNNIYSFGEIGSNPINMHELLDRLAAVVEKSMERLEDSITNRIIIELNNRFSILERKMENIHDGTPVAIDIERNPNNDASLVDKLKFMSETDKSLQCNLVGNEINDSLMLTFSAENAKTSINEISSIISKNINHNILENHSNVIELPSNSMFTSERKVDAVISKTKSILSGPITFIRENILIITSIPAFFVVLLCFYGLLSLIIKPF